MSQLVEEDQLTCSPTGMPRTLNRVSVPLIDSLLTVDLALARWLKDPTSQKPTAHMPKIAMSEAEAQALAVYLGSLR